MTKKHFMMLAEMLHNTKPIKDGVAMTQWTEDVGAVAAVCYNMNPRFDRHKFYEACGVKEEQVPHW